MSINFTKFPSLENTYRQKEIDIIQSMMIQDKWVVTEKVHGCFPSNTRVMLPDGSHKTIKEIVDTKEAIVHEELAENCPRFC